MITRLHAWMSRVRFLIARGRLSDEASDELRWHHDFGLRIALGALRSDVMRWVFVTGMRPAVIGLAVGLFGTILLTQTLRGLLFGVTPTDPLSLGLVVVILLIASSLACYFPERRAAELDPLVALRHE